MIRQEEEAQSSTFQLYTKNLEKIASLAEESLTSLCQLSIDAAQAIAGTALNMLSMRDMLIEHFADCLESILSQIEVPGVSEEEKAQLLSSFQAWGKCGWTVLPDADYDFFYTPPSGLPDANKKAMAYCRAENMLALFSALREMKGNQADLEEAIQCFTARNYKACALLLCAMIDGRLIRSQAIRKPGEGRRPSGSGASRKLWEQLQQESESGKLHLFSYLQAANLFAYLPVLFAGGNDFREQPDLLNRNFIGHGMYTKKVLKRDCIQLFLAYYNLLDVLSVPFVE